MILYQSGRQNNYFYVDLSVINKENMMNILYSRVSSKGQENNTSLDYQNKRLKDYCKLNKVSDLITLQDVDSGGNTKRSGILSMEHLIRTGRISAIYITKLDRLYRSVLDGSRFIKLCIDNKVDIQATDEPISTKSPVEMLQINLLLSIADFERSNIKSRTLQGKSSTFEAGNRAHGMIPIGYNKSMKVNDQALVVKKIFSKYNKVKSVTKVTAYINSQDYTTNNNKSFSRKSVYNILKNPTYVGLIKFGSVTKLGNHSPIISKRLFNSVNNSLSR